MKAIVLAGGFGTRLKPLTERMPKPLLPVAGRPCIDFVLHSLVSAGFKEIIIATSYMSDRVMKRMGDGLDYDASILYSFEATPAGTAGAVKRVADFIEDTFVVASGDVLADVNIGELYEYHKEKGSLATMALTRVEDPTQFGIVGLDEDDRIVRFQEKPPEEEIFSNLVNAGIYVLEPRVLEFIPEGKMFDFSMEVFPLLLKKGLPVCGMELDGLWMDIGRPRDLWRASMEVVKRRGKEATMEGVTLRGLVVISDEAVIEKGVEIEGPSYIGKGATLSRGSKVRRSCVYDNVFLDREAVVENSIVMEDSRVGWRSVIQDSVVSSACSIEEDVRLISSVIGDEMNVRAHSRLEGASVAPPTN
ncbi:MAG: sugar phosphate nucleotidyltransferase [Thermoplasmata archaeon]